MAIRSCCFRGKMASVSIRREWTISRGDAYRFRIRTTLLAHLKSEARSRRRFYDNWAARGPLHSISPGAIEDGIIFGWSLQRALHSPLAGAEQHPPPPPAPWRIHFLTLIIYIYFIYSLSRSTDAPACHRRNVICEKPGGPGTRDLLRRSPDSSSIEDLGC